MIIIRIKQIIFILRKKQVIILATDLSNNKTNPKENVLSNSDSSSAVKESVLYQLIYNDNFHLTEDIFFGAGFNKFKSAIIVKYLTFNKFDDYTSLDALRCNLRKLFPDFSVDSILEVPNTILFLITTEKSEKDFFFSEILTLLYNHLEQITKKNKISPATMGISKPLDSISSINSVLKSTADVFKNAAKIMPGEIRFFDEYEEVFFFKLLQSFVVVIIFRIERCNFLLAKRFAQIVKAIQLDVGNCLGKLFFIGGTALVVTEYTH